MRAKKGMFFEFMMFIVILLVLVTAFTTLYKKHGQFPVGYRIGDRQFSLMDAIQKGEFVLFYVDQSAEYALDESVTRLAEQGGIFNSKCGRFNGANIWLEIEKTEDGYRETDCFDENKANESLIAFFNESVNTQLADNPYGLPNENYEYQIKGDNFTGSAKMPLKIEIKRKK